MQARPLKVALVQMTSGTDVSANVAEACRGIMMAAAQGAQYVQTPEMTTLVRRGRDEANPDIYGKAQLQALESFRALARNHKVTVHIGSMPIAREDGRLANRGFIIGPDGEVRAQYDKIHLFDVAVSETETWRESAIYAPGESLGLAEVEGAVFGMSICYDIRFPQLYRTLAQKGAEVLTVPAAFTVPTGRAHWQTLLRARAIENGAFVIAAAQTGEHADGRRTWGHSLIVNPWGDIVVECGEAPGVFLAEIDLSEVAATRSRLPSLNHDRPFA